jgi:hypothetical protein
MENDKCCSQLSTYIKRDIAFRKADELLSGKIKFDAFFKSALLLIITDISDFVHRPVF